MAKGASLELGLLAKRALSGTKRQVTSWLRQSGLGSDTAMCMTLSSGRSHTLRDRRRTVALDWLWLFWFRIQQGHDI